MKAGDILDEARDFSSAFRNLDGGEKAPLRALSRIQQGILSNLSQETPEAVSVQHEIAMNDLLAALGGDRYLSVPEFIITLPNLRIGLAVGATTLATAPVSVVPLTDQLKPGADFPSVAFSSGKLWVTDLRLAGGSDHGWEDYVGPLVYRYVPMPPYLEGLDDDLSVPDGLRAALAQELAVWMATRMGDSGLVAILQGQAATVMHHYIDSVRLQERGTPWTVLDNER